MTIESPDPRPDGAPVARPARNDWRIDTRTRRTGLEGLARARKALEATRSAAGVGQPDAA